MRTITLSKLKNLHRCLTFRQSICLVFTCLVAQLHAGEIKHLSRAPASVEEEVLTVPLNNDSFFTNENIFAEDDSGVMRDMKDSLRSWERTDEFANQYDLKSTGLYNTPSGEQRAAYVRSKILRYADKRLSGEMRKADEGSTLHKVSKVEKQLHPNAAVNISKNFGLKFKARVLQGKAMVDVKNPWVECTATIGLNGKAKVVTRKEFKQIGVASGAEYAITEGQFLTYIDKQLTDNVKARISSKQEKSTDVFGNDADKRFEMTASFPFNL